MPSVLGWTDIAFAGVCVRLCVSVQAQGVSCGSLEAFRDTFCILNTIVEGCGNEYIYVVLSSPPDWARNTLCLAITKR